MLQINPNENQINNWKEKINQQKISGKSISAWCRENKILYRSFFYWRSKIFSKKIDHSNFIELKEEKKTNIILEYWGININLDKNFDSEILKKCLILLKEMPC